MDGFSTEWVAGWLAGCYIGGARKREGKKIACARNFWGFLAPESVKNLAFGLLRWWEGGREGGRVVAAANVKPCMLEGGGGLS